MLTLTTRYEQLPEVLEALTAAYMENPRDATTAAHIGRLLACLAPERASAHRDAVSDDYGHIVLSRKYFAEAVRLAPDDWRFKGFLASMDLAEGALHGDEMLTRQGYFSMMQSIKGWPEFNLMIKTTLIKPQSAAVISTTRVPNIPARNSTTVIKAPENRHHQSR